MVEHGAPPADPQGAVDRYARVLRLLREGARIPTGQTPKTTVWGRNKARLYHYTPVVPRSRPVPVLLVYALINRPYILDLIPGGSFVQYLLGRGYDVYLLDWGVPGDEDQGLDFADYVLDYLPAAVRRMLRHSGAPAFTLLGYCMGGTMSAMYSALFPDPPLRNLVLLTTPLDFSPEVAGVYGQWLRQPRFDPDRIVAAFGNVPPEVIGAANRLLRPMANTLGPYVALWDLVARDQSTDQWRALNQWVDDGIPFPGAAFRQWIRDFYQQDRLARGTLVLRQRPVDLGRITCAVLNIGGRRDHICPPAQAAATMRLLASRDATFQLLDAGHASVMTGPRAVGEVWPGICRWLEPRSRAAPRRAPPRRAPRPADAPTPQLAARAPAGYAPTAAARVRPSS